MLTVTPDPFPHVIADGLWPDQWLEDVLAEFPPPDAPWRRYDGEHEQGKAEGSNPVLWGRRTDELIKFLCSDQWCTTLGMAFGIEGLVGDWIGGGYHQIAQGGRLDIHVDFNRHPKTGMHRRLNCLIYLNHDWREWWGGALELHGPDHVVTVEPLFNRTAIFATSESSWHGHPQPWQGPTPRRSIAVYYFSPDPATSAEPHSTVWKG